MNVLRTVAFSRSQLISLVGGTVFLVAMTGCQRKNEPTVAAAPLPQESPASPAPAPAEGQPAQAEQPLAAPPAPILVQEVGFKTPESVLYDEDQDVYLVSNVNGRTTETNGSGFISKLGPDGQVIELKWIDGTKPDVNLNAPKGMAISGDKLYVTDITFVRVFDRKTGKPLGKIGAAGASFLNGIAAAPDGTIYVSDTGIKEGKEGFEPSGTDAIFRIGPRGVAEPLLKGPELNRPNGLLADNEGVWVASYGSNELYRVSIKDNEGTKEKVQKLPSGALDGLVQTADGSVLVASWDGSAVYRGTLGGTFSPVAQDVKSPADIGYDSKRNALLIPLFDSDAVRIQSLGAPPVAKAPPAAASPAQPAPAASPAAPAPASAPPAGKQASTAGASPSPAAGAPSAQGTTPQGKQPAPAAESKAPSAAPAPAAPAPAAPAPAAPAPQPKQ